VGHAGEGDGGAKIFCSGSEGWGEDNPVGSELSTETPRGRGVGVRRTSLQSCTEWLT